MKKEIIIKNISIILIIISILTLSLKYYKKYVYKQIEQKSINNYIKKQTYNIPTKKTNEIKQTNNNYNYLAILEIPSISLKKGIFNINDQNNNANKNIQILNKSQMPNIENSNLLLASHNGNSEVSYFKNLYKLKENDLIYLYYEQYKYIYKFSYSYEIKKTGEINILKHNNQTILTLITCKKNSSNTQIVFISYLEDKEKI